jgi:hypothetical protein
MKTLLSVFTNETQRFLAKALFITMVAGLLGMIIMSALGAKTQSFHIVSLEIGWGKLLFDLFSNCTFGGLMVLLGMYSIPLTNKFKNKDVNNG